MNNISPTYKIRHEWASRGYDGETCWVQCRAGAIPTEIAGGKQPTVIMTMQKLALSGSDVFFELNDMRSDDLGTTWSQPIARKDTLGRRIDEDGLESVICDATPSWHTATNKLLATGHVAQYKGDALAPGLRRRSTAYTVYDHHKREWTKWRSLAMPSMDGRFFNSGAGCTQRVDLTNGDILLPIYFKPFEQDTAGDDPICALATVCRCSFDGQTLRYLEHGTELSCPDPRGFGEPSLARFQGRFFLTLRNDIKGWVTSSSDGLNFEEPRPWRFDDGSELGNYNTQQHWVTHPNALFLVYTRRGLNNDHVFRHRAPLVMAQVDPEKLVVLRDTERVVVPERGARLGNFGVTQISDNETWIVAGEWMQNNGLSARKMMDRLGLRATDDPWPPKNGHSPHFSRECEGFGSDNTIWIARILWDA